MVDQSLPGRSKWMVGGGGDDGPLDFLDERTMIDDINSHPPHAEASTQLPLGAWLKEPCLSLSLVMLHRMTFSPA